MFVFYVQRSISSAVSFYALFSGLRGDDSIDEIAVTLTSVFCLFSSTHDRSTGGDIAAAATSSSSFFLKWKKKTCRVPLLWL